MRPKEYPPTLSAKISQGSSHALSCIYFLLALLLSGCAAKPNQVYIERKGDYHVEVRGPAVVLDSTKKGFVRSLPLSSSLASNLRKQWSEELRRPFTSKLLENGGGESYSLQILDISEDHKASRLGLESGDVVVSIGRELIKDVNDFAKVFEEVAKNREVYVTLYRNGVPLKIVYYPENVGRDSIPKP